MKFNFMRQMIVTALLMTSLLALVRIPESLGANQAIIIGPTYPGGPAFDDVIAQTRANQMSQSLSKWGNWNAANIQTLTGGVTCANITAAINTAAGNLQANDIFLLIYHGHGSFLNDVEVVPPARDNCDESIWPNQHCLDDAITASLGAIPAGVSKFIILACCYSGGFWNGNDPPGDLERLTKICLLAGCSECQCLPEPSVFVNNLLQRLDPGGWPGQNSVTFQGFIDSIRTGATGSTVNSNRWGTPLPKCPCTEPDSVFRLYDFDWQADVSVDTGFKVYDVFLRVTQHGSLQFSSPTYSVLENGGSVTITVTRTGGSAGQVGVSYATSGGTATPGVDYFPTSGTITWADGDMSPKTFTIPIIDDGVYEGNETVNLSLNNPTGGATLGSPSTAVLTIVDDEGQPPPPGRPTLSQWVLIVLALSVGGFFIWQLKRRRRAGVSA